MDSFVKLAAQVGFVLRSKPRISEYNFKSTVDRNIRLRVLRFSGNFEVEVTSGKIEAYVLYRKSFEGVDSEQIMNDVLESLPFYSSIARKYRKEM